jgi:hypothetical protein
MRHPSRFLVTVLIGATLALAGAAAAVKAQESQAGGHAAPMTPFAPVAPAVAVPARQSVVASPAPAVATPVAATPPPRRPPARLASAGGDQYRCHPDEDIACTIVRETSRGLVISTVRPIRTQGSWSVVSGVPAGSEMVTGGTIYVVPSAAAVTRDRDESITYPNGAPILD